MTSRFGRTAAVVTLALSLAAVIGFGAGLLPGRPGVASGSVVAEQESVRAVARASTGSCGIERWAVKTGTDAGAGSVATTTIVSTTIANLRSLTAPTSLPSSTRVAPTENTVFRLDATLYQYKLETDSDYHLVLQDAAGSTMIAEIPDPACVGATSPFAGAITAARAAFDARLSATSTFQTAGLQVQVSGVGFFDFLHGQTGVAPNGIELHSVLSISFGPPGPTGSPLPSAFRPLAPTRLLDTRTGVGAPPYAVGPQGMITVPIAGRAGIPLSATAVAMNVTATETSGDGYLTVFPAGIARPLASSLNWRAGETVPNLVFVSIGALGSVSLYNSAGTTQLVADVSGWLGTPSVGATDGLWNPVLPARTLDTRIGLGAPSASPIGPGSALTLQISGRGGVPGAGVSAVALNVTATNPTAASYLTVYPAGGTLPLASNLNFILGQTVPNRVVVPVGASGAVSIFNFLGAVDVIADVSGWFTDSSPGGAGAMFTSLTPMRLLDTRDGTGGFSGKLGPGGSVSLQVSGRGGVPDVTSPTPPGSIALNVTATDPTSGAYLTAWPDQWPRPLASDLNLIGGSTVANLVLVGIGPNGRVDVFNSAGCSNVVVDVVGWFSGPPTAPAVPVASPPVVPCPPPVSPPPPPAALSVVIGQSVYGAVAATTASGSTCTAQARLPSGNLSQAQGLTITKVADGAGNVSWTYGTSSRTTPGVGTHTVTCSLNGATASAQAPFTVP